MGSAFHQKIVFVNISIVPSKVLLEYILALLRTLTYFCRLFKVFFRYGKKVHHCCNSQSRFFTNPAIFFIAPRECRETSSQFSLLQPKLVKRT